MRPASVGLALSLLVAAVPSRGDTFFTIGDGQLEDASHTIEITLGRDHAVLHVERVLRNESMVPAGARVDLVTPDALVAVGLDVPSASDAGTAWQRALLLDAGVATERYAAMSAEGIPRTGAAALFSWVAVGHHVLRVAPVAPRREKRVRYTWMAPMRYEGGRYRLKLEAMGTKDKPARALVKVHSGRALRDSREIEGAFDLTEPVTIEQEVGFQSLVEGQLASVPAGDDKALAGFHFDVAPRLSEVPRGAHVVVIVDGSRSVPDEARAASLAAASSYLSHFDGESSATVLAFHRTVEDLSGGFVSIDAARAVLRSATLPGNNGSEVGAALARAREILGRAPAGAPRRVLLLTDTLTRAAIDPEKLGASAPERAILHIAVVREGWPRVRRDDDAPWAALARATGGVLWRASSSSKPDHESARRAAFEEWARPISIDRVRLRGPALDEEEIEVVMEGESVERHFVAEGDVASVELTGELWSSPLSKTLKPDPDYGRRRAALAFGGFLLNDLPASSRTALARHGGAVTATTSYLAIEPGGRDSWMERFGVGFGRMVGSSSSTGLTCSLPASEVRVHPTFEKLLGERVRAAAHACGISRGAATVTLEATLREIAGVSVAGVAQEPGACLAEAVWAMDLPETAIAEHAEGTIRI